MWGLDHAQTVRLDEDSVRLAPPEYVIRRKLQFYREGRSEKHLCDVSRMLARLGEEWDRAPLLTMVSRYGLVEKWNSTVAFDD